MRTLIAFLVIACCAASTPCQSDEAALGSKLADFRFESVVMNGDGFVTGDAFLGRPVLYEFWGFR